MSLPKRVIRVGINLAIHCGMSTTALKYKGASVLALCDALVDQGVGVELVTFDCTTSLSTTVPRLVWKMVIKKSSDPLSIEDLCFFVSSVAGTRLIALQDQARSVSGTVDCGTLGSPDTLPLAESRRLDFFSDFSSSQFTLDDARRWVGECLEKYSSSSVEYPVMV